RRKTLFRLLLRILCIMGLTASPLRAQENTSKNSSDKPVGAENSANEKELEPAAEEKKDVTRTLDELTQRVSELESQLEELRSKERPSKSDEEPPGQSETNAADEQLEAQDGEESEDTAERTRQRASLNYYDANARPIPIELMPEILAGFRFHGYLRSGAGVSSNGRAQEVFQAPGAETKYRLGNEQDTYGELAFANDWLETHNASDPDGPGFVTQVRIGFSTDQTKLYNPEDNIWILEAFAMLGNILPNNPGAKFWAGERFYRRHDIHIIDFFFQNTSSYGGGIEDFDIKIGKLSVAYLAASDASAEAPDGQFAQHNLDIRLSDIAIGANSTLMVWAFPSVVAGGTLIATGEQVDTDGGIAGGLIFQTNDLWGGYNKASFQAGMGTSASFTPNGAGSGGKGSYKFRFTDQLVVQPIKQISGQLAIVLSEQNFSPLLSTQEESRVRWASVGVRPIWHVNKFLRLQAEVGADFVKNDPGDINGILLKTTGAVGLAPRREFFSRPEVRLFATHAAWTEGFRGLVGGAPFLNDKAGTTFGVQMEAWW
ncbi:MAG: carbohydrate porin, partial [Polyangiaceae bacterium]|nr:carbohydrate porin [Polyangiaceae bacterium]